MPERPPILRSNELINPNSGLVDFKQLLKTPQENLIFYPTSLEEIKNFLDDEIGAHLDPRLINELGFQDFEWQLVTVPKSLSALFIGGYNVQQINEAYGTIHLDRFLESNVVVPYELRVGGVGYDSRGDRRSMAIKYNSNGKATGFNVAIRSHEIPNVWHRKQELGFSTFDVLTRFPTDPDDPYTVEGLVTPAMIRETSLKYSEGLRFYDNTGTGDIGFMQVVSRYDKGSERFHLIENDDYLMACDRQEGNRWIVALPKQLEPKAA